MQRKKLTQAKHIARSTGMPNVLNYAYATGSQRIAKRQETKQHGHSVARRKHRLLATNREICTKAMRLLNIEKTTGNALKASRPTNEKRNGRYLRRFISIVTAETNKKLCYSRGPRDPLVSIEILQLRNIPFEKACN